MVRQAVREAECIMTGWGKMTTDWQSISSVIVYGYGNYFQEKIKLLQNDVQVVFIIDNNQELTGGSYGDIPIYSFDEAKVRIENYKIVIMAETVARSNIKKELQSRSYEEYRDFVDFERFYTEYGYHVKKAARLLELHSPITNQCTLRCKKCNMFIPYQCEKYSADLNGMKKDLSILMKYIDYIDKYQIIGGEPLLHSNIADYITYLRINYTNKIGRIRIVTNGTVVPDEKLLYAIKDCRRDIGVEVVISDYRDSIGYEKQFNKVAETFRANKITYEILKSLKWRDVIFPEKIESIEKSRTRKHMELCGTSWHGLAEGKVYYCNCTWAAQKTGLFKPDKTDYIELDELTDFDKGKEDIMSLCLGDYEKGYNSFCGYCGGLGEDNQSIVAAGGQI